MSGQHFECAARAFGWFTKDPRHYQIGMRSGLLLYGSALDEFRNHPRIGQTSGGCSLWGSESCQFNRIEGDGHQLASGTSCENDVAARDVSGSEGVLVQKLSFLSGFEVELPDTSVPQLTAGNGVDHGLAARQDIRLRGGKGWNRRSGPSVLLTWRVLSDGLRASVALTCCRIFLQPSEAPHVMLVIQIRWKPWRNPTPRYVLLGYSALFRCGWWKGSEIALPAQQQDQTLFTDGGFRAYLDAGFGSKEDDVKLKHRLAVLLMTLWSSGLAHAETISIIRSFSDNRDTARGLVFPIFDLFYEGLGTLDSVSLTIQRSMIVEVFTPQFLLPNPIPPFFVPAPYPYSVEILQSFGLQSFGMVLPIPPLTFEFARPAKFVFSGIAPGTASTSTFVLNYSYQFSFNGVTDLLGFTVPITTNSLGVLRPPLRIFGTVSAFSSEHSGVRSNFTRRTRVGSQKTLAHVTGFRDSGTIQMDFNYTPIEPPDPPLTVPEPASLSLLGIGIVLLAARLRKRARS